MKLEISLFKFDKNSDYLPYYTKHFLKIENEKNILEILKTINKTAKLGFKDCKNFDLVINGVYVKADITTKEIVENFGKELTIEPISIRRAYNDLLIDDNDFIEKFKILKNYTTDEDEVTYSNLKQYYYASNTLNYNSDYIGDAVLLLAYDLIQKTPNHSNYILNVLNDFEIGAQYHTSLENRIYNIDDSIEEKIQDIQKRLNIFEDLDKQNFRINNTLILDFGNFEDNYEIKHDFNDFNIAYYPSKNNEKTLELLEKLDAKILNLATLKLDLAKNTFNKNPKITYCVASTILLDAFDTNADFLLVDTSEDFYIFDYNRKQIEKISGREIILPVIYINELQKLASGKHDEARKTLEKQNFRLNKTLIIDFGVFEENYEIKHNFKDFNIAYYPSKNPKETFDLLNKLDANILKLDSMKLDLAKNTFNKNPQITYLVASTILLDAFDNNADFLLVDTFEDFYIFDYNRKQLEKLSGREIILPIIHKNELQKLASGKHSEAKKTLDKHQINPEII